MNAFIESPDFHHRPDIPQGFRDRDTSPHFRSAILSGARRDWVRIVFVDNNRTVNEVNAMRLGGDGTFHIQWRHLRGLLERKTQARGVQGGFDVATLVVMASNNVLRCRDREFRLEYADLP